MAALWARLKGKKTYIGIVASFILSALFIAKVVPIDSQYAQLIGAAILTFTGVSYRSAVGTS